MKTRIRTARSKTTEDATPTPTGEPRDRRSFGIELRSFGNSRVELRADGGLRVLSGHAAVFNSLSLPLSDYGYPFRERIAPGAFAESIAKADVRALWNHMDAYVLGRTAARTLSLLEDDTGLLSEIKPPGTSWAKDLLISIDRGDVNQMSFRFQVPKGGQSWSVENGEDIRTVTKAHLIEVSIVTFPAYTATGIRSSDGAPEIDFNGAYERLVSGQATPEDLVLMRRAAALLDEKSGPSPLETLDLMSRRLRLAAI